MIVNASIEARMTSSRLPGKVLMSLNNKPSLQLMIERVSKSQLIDNIIIATTINITDDPIVELCEKLKIKYHRGSEEDVLQRVLDAHKKYNSDIIVELTGDCPLIDPKIIDKCINYYLNNKYDYISNCLERSYPMGMEVEIFSLKLLDKISKLTTRAEDREHVSTYFYKSGKFNISNISAEPEFVWPDLGLTLDTIEDYKLINCIVVYFKDSLFSLNEIIVFLKNNRELLNYNKNIERKNIDGY